MEQADLAHIQTFLKRWLVGANFRLTHIKLDGESTPSAFLKWAFLPLKVTRVEDVIEVPIFSFRNGNTTFFKVPHPHQLYHFMPLETVIHNLFLPNI